MKITVKEIEEAAKTLTSIVIKSPLQYSDRLSRQYDANIYLKREDLQPVRSFKLRGAYNKIMHLNDSERKNGIVTASAGNHAQGVAYACAQLRIHGVIFMPTITPNQKIQKVKYFGGSYVTIKLIGTTFDEANVAAQEFCTKEHACFVHPFNDPLVISGQGTVAKEIFDELGEKLDSIIVTIGGGGLIAGVATYLKDKNKNINIYGVEPEGADSMRASLDAGHIVSLDTIDTFVDGAAVRVVGDLTLKIAKAEVKKVLTVPVGAVCTSMIELYQNEGIIAEPAGALSVSALEQLKAQLKGKTVVVIITGGNNDIMRYPEILEKSLVYRGLKHYFIIEFAQKPGALKNFLNHVLTPSDDIVLFEYMKKTNKEKGPALVGIELKNSKHLSGLLERMKTYEITYRKITTDDLVYNYLV